MDEKTRKVVNELKPVIPQPKTGHWISVNTGKQIHLKDGRAVESVKCSECDEWLIASDEYDCNGNYCPNCGAKMIEPQAESEGSMIKKLAELTVIRSADYYDKVARALEDAGFVMVLTTETTTDRYYIIAESEGKYDKRRNDRGGK